MPLPFSLFVVGYTVLWMKWVRQLRLTSFEKILLLALPLELSLTLIATHAWYHYYILLIPIYILLSGEGLSFMLGLFNVKVYQRLVLVSLLFIAIFLSMQTSHNLKVIPRTINAHPTIKVIHEYVDEDESLLFWGSGGGIWYFSSQRRLPSRYIYPYDFLTTRGYQSVELIEEYVEILKDRPTRVDY